MTSNENQREREDVIWSINTSKHMNALQLRSLEVLHSLIKGGAKFIDIRIRKDSKEYVFEADYLKHLKPPYAYEPVAAEEIAARTQTPASQAVTGDVVVERDGFKGIVCNETNIDFVGYDPERELLRVEYTNGRRYNYQDVAAHFWTALGYAKSKGGFLAAHIKGNFRYYCVNGD